MNYEYIVDYDKNEDQGDHHVKLLCEVDGVEEEAGEEIVSYKVLHSSVELIKSRTGIKLVEV